MVEGRKLKLRSSEKILVGLTLPRVGDQFSTAASRLDYPVAKSIMIRQWKL